MIGRLLGLLAVVLALLAAGAARRRVEILRAVEGLDPTVIDEVALRDGTTFQGRVVERTADGVRYRLEEVEIPRDLVRDLRPGDPASNDFQDRVVLRSGAEWSGRLVGAGRELVLSTSGREIAIPAGEIESIRRAYESDVQAFLASHLGSVRPIANYVFWWQADETLRHRQYWELPALYERISKIQPFNQFVWLFNGWNLAFNVAAQQDSVEQQWPWIRQGIEFLMQGSRKIPESWEIPFQIGFTINQKCEGEPYFQEKVLEVFGTGQKRWRELAADWSERARSRPGHYAFNCSNLFDAKYQDLMAEALYEGDEAAYEVYRRRAQSVLDHHRVAHAEETRDFPRPLPDRGPILQRMGWNHLRAVRGPGADVERARGYFALASEAFDREGEKALAASSRTVARAIERLAEGLRLAERKNFPGAHREWQTARALLEIELLPYWLPFQQGIGPAGTGCQGIVTAYPSYVERVYELVVEAYSGPP